MLKVLLRAKKGVPHPDYNGHFKQITEHHRRSDLGCSIIIPDCGPTFLDMHSTFEWPTKGTVSIASRNVRTMRRMLTTTITDLPGLKPGAHTGHASLKCAISASSAWVRFKGRLHRKSPFCRRYFSHCFILSLSRA